MEKINTIENSIIALENALNLSITIIDNAGAFHTSQSISILSYARQSHKKNQICKIGFCKKCIDFCRYSMNEKTAVIQEPLVETCWKGVSEIIVPLNQNNIHYGMLYAGSWQQNKVLPASNLPKKFYKIYKQLPLLPQGEEMDKLKDLLAIFTAGILVRLKRLNAFGGVPDTRGNRIMEFIQAHAVERIELSSVAAHLDLSCSRTSYLIRNTLNKSFPELLNEERLRRVKTLLVSSNMTLNEIAIQTGFNDEYYLARTFKKQNGQTPGQYRKNHTTRLSL